MYKMGDYGFEGAGDFGGNDSNFNCRPDGPVGTWAVYSLCDIPLGVGEVIDEGSDWMEISYGRNRTAEVYSRNNCETYRNIGDAVKKLIELSDDFTIEDQVEDLSMAFPDERVSLESLLEE